MMMSASLEGADGAVAGADCPQAAPLTARNTADKKNLCMKVSSGAVCGVQAEGPTGL
jgi:hypothetical protein